MMNIRFYKFYISKKLIKLLTTVSWFFWLSIMIIVTNVVNTIISINVSYIDNIRHHHLSKEFYLLSFRWPTIPYYYLFINKFNHNLDFLQVFYSYFIKFSTFSRHPSFSKQERFYNKRS